MTQLIECPTLDLGSGHDLIIGEIELHVGLCADNAEPAWDALSPSLSLPLLYLLFLSLSLSLSLSLKINKLNFFKSL